MNAEGIVDMALPESDRPHQDVYKRQALLSAIPCRRFGRPEDLAKVLVFLSSDIAEYMNGTEVYISGGKFCTQNPQYGWEHMV